MILCDTGPLVALINKADADHDTCVETVAALAPEVMLTTHACLTEAMHFLRRAGGWRPQAELWGYVTDGLLCVHVPRAEELERMLELMRKYADTPMDLADASIVAAAETLNHRRVFTTDRHFYAYRQKQGAAFEVVP